MYRLSPWPSTSVLAADPHHELVCDMWESMVCMYLFAKEKERAVRFFCEWGEYHLV